MYSDAFPFLTDAIISQYDIKFEDFTCKRVKSYGILFDVVTGEDNGYEMEIKKYYSSYSVNWSEYLITDWMKQSVQAFNLKFKEIESFDWLIDKINKEIWGDVNDLPF